MKKKSLRSSIFGAQGMIKSLNCRELSSISCKKKKRKFYFHLLGNLISSCWISFRHTSLPSIVRPIGISFVAKDFDIAFEYQHLVYNRDGIRMLRIKALSSIVPSVLPFELLARSVWKYLSSSNQMHPKRGFQRYSAAVQWHMVHPKLQINQSFRAVASIITVHSKIDVKFSHRAGWWVVTKQTIWMLCSRCLEKPLDLWIFCRWLRPCRVKLNFSDRQQWEIHLLPQQINRL